MTLKSFLGAAALTVAAGIGGAFMPAMAMAQAPATTAPAPEPQAIVVPDIVLGNPDATVTLTEYASYTCPHCASFHANVFKDLKRDYIDTGKIKFVYREVYFDRPGLWAAMIARCGGDMRYFGIQEMIYGQQREWLSSNDPVAQVTALRKFGLSAGLTNETLDSCLSNADMAQAMVEKFKADSTADNVTSTPSLIVNGKMHGNMSYADLKAILDAQLAK